LIADFINLEKYTTLLVVAGLWSFLQWFHFLFLIKQLLRATTPLFMLIAGVSRDSNRDCSRNIAASHTPTTTGGIFFTTS
jgi:hypothetical protein